LKSFASNCERKGTIFFDKRSGGDFFAVCGLRFTIYDGGSASSNIVRFRRRFRLAELPLARCCSPFLFCLCSRDFRFSFSSQTEWWWQFRNKKGKIRAAKNRLQRRSALSAALVFPLPRPRACTIPRAQRAESLSYFAIGTG